MTTTDLPVLPVLREAREFLADERRWCANGVFGTTQIDGEPVRTRCASMAVEYGVRRALGLPQSGGVGEAALGPMHGLYIAATVAVARAAGLSVDSYSRLGVASRLGLWNDDPERTHADVLAAFDKAIAEAGS